MPYVWGGQARRPPQTRKECRKDEGTKYCYEVPQHQGIYNRGNHGVYEWPGVLGITIKDFEEQKRGFKAGSIQLKDGREQLQWEDIVDQVLDVSIRKSKNKAYDGNDDDYVGKIETRFWKSIIQQANGGSCNDAADCQRVLPLIGCVIYWLWKGQKNLLKPNSKAEQKCEEIRAKMLNDKKTVKIIGKDNWSRLQRVEGTCQGRNSFQKCTVEALSLVLTVADSLTVLCPQCPTQGLDRFLTENIEYTDKPCFRYRTIGGGYEICEGVDNCHGAENREGIDCFCDPMTQGLEQGMSSRPTQSLSGKESGRVQESIAPDPQRSDDNDRPGQGLKPGETTPGYNGGGPQDRHGADLSPLVTDESSQGQEPKSKGEAVNQEREMVTGDEGKDQINEAEELRPGKGVKGDPSGTKQLYSGNHKHEKVEQATSGSLSAIPAEEERQEGPLVGTIMGSLAVVVMFVLSGYGLYRVYGKTASRRNLRTPGGRRRRVGYMTRRGRTLASEGIGESLRRASHPRDSGNLRNRLRKELSGTPIWRRNLNAASSRDQMRSMCRSTQDRSSRDGAFDRETPTPPKEQSNPHFKDSDTLSGRNFPSPTCPVYRPWD
ncbi:hypothetical protein C922_05656 [Plasmodium inui San Antonio 1]|uniref:Uncharacterized protein n=1 Tax=Plasmodium inui San Antonio 1 TaxID=1237626 RepID=W7AF94_9APIC|nr:hypothetical protein C922_05656 [Plasmodium inui San Antonio 1]EUD63961.1 hypothetical protein C922_05656 [Plasmodium inui San Antonio 1]